jgi:superfamily I DNA/RNA helicase
VKIERFRGPAMCVEVPGVGRFLQDGFDGCNSKGLERSRVWLLRDTFLRRRKGPRDLPPSQEEKNIYFVAATRAKLSLRLVSSNEGQDS